MSNTRNCLLLCFLPCRNICFLTELLIDQIFYCRLWLFLSYSACTLFLRIWHMPMMLLLRLTCAWRHRTEFLISITICTAKHKPNLSDRICEMESSRQALRFCLPSPDEKGLPLPSTPFRLQCGIVQYPIQNVGWRIACLMWQSWVRPANLRGALQQYLFARNQRGGWVDRMYFIKR